MCIQAFFIRGGQNWGHRAFFPAHTSDVPEDEVLSSFLVQFYEDVPPPQRILVDRELADSEAARRGAVRASGPAGRHRDVPSAATGRSCSTRRVAMPRKRSTAGSPRRPRRARSFASWPTRSSLPDVPKRIEVYDNSHIMGTNAIGAMIVAGPEGFRKNSYRKFNIKRPETQPGDDFAMMREVLERRFARLREGRSRPSRAANGPTCC